MPLAEVIVEEETAALDDGVARVLAVIIVLLGIDKLVAGVIGAKVDITDELVVE